MTVRVWDERWERKKNANKRRCSLCTCSCYVLTMYSAYRRGKNKTARIRLKHRNSNDVASFFSLPASSSTSKRTRICCEVVVVIIVLVLMVVAGAQNAKKKGQREKMRERAREESGHIRTERRSCSFSVRVRFSLIRKKIFFFSQHSCWLFNMIDATIPRMFTCVVFS